METKKTKIKNLIDRGCDRREIIRKVGTTAGYLTKVLSELRLEGFDIPKAKTGCPRAFSQEQAGGKIASR